VYHHIERTSPKGETFRGTCRLCGQQNLTALDARRECPNVRSLSPGEAVSETLNGQPLQKPTR